MSLSISPLSLKLDKQNPRFVAISDNSEASIRKYMASYEDVCLLAEGINNNRGLMLGERIVVIHENSEYVVMEGNRRTVALQFLLNRSLIPDGFDSKIPNASSETLDNITTVEVDIAPDRDYAIALMTKRHIEGVKNWKPLAKKQFFATMYNQGNSINTLSSKTGVTVADIRKDIRDYKFLLKVSKKYKDDHPAFSEDLINIKIDPFLRIFSAAQLVGTVKKKPIDLLKIKYDSQENIVSELPDEVFAAIVEKIFRETIVDKNIKTRNSLFDVPGVKSLLDALSETSTSGNDPVHNGRSASNGEPTPDDGPAPSGGTAPGDGTVPNSRPTPSGGPTPSGETAPGGGPTPSGGTASGGGPALSGGPASGGGPALSGGPAPGGSAPGTFFEHISWSRLSPANIEHSGLIVALDELYKMSTNTIRTGGKTEKVYQVFSVGAGMVLRTAYEQALKLQLKKTGLWSSLVTQFQMPMLSNIETHIKNNINIALPESTMRTAFNQVINSRSRDFLNITVHNPGLVRTTASSLEGLASGGICSLIQLIINNI